MTGWHIALLVGGVVMVIVIAVVLIIYRFLDNPENYR